MSLDHSSDRAYENGEETGEEERSRKKKKHKRSSRRSRSRSRSKPKSKSRSRRSRSRSRRKRSRSKRRKSISRSRSPIDPQRKAEEAERELNRDAYTIFVTQLHPKVEERDLFEFFSHVGRVEDIRLIRDQRTHKSKGLAYIEFWEKDCVNKAIALTGQHLGGYPITVQITPSSALPSKAEEIKPLRLYVGNLHPNVSESDLRPIFEPFGTVDSIDLHKDSSNGKSKGFGFVTYRNESDGKQALQNLNGLEIANRFIKVSVMSDTKDDSNDGIGFGDLDEDGASVTLTADARVRLMQKLQRGNELAVPGLSSGSGKGPSSSSAQSRSAVIASADHLSVPRIQPSTCVVVKGMFDPAEEKDPEFHLDIKEDVEEECRKFGKLKHIFVDKNSQGHVYLRFEEIDGAKRCIDNLNGRWFASKRITAEFVVETTYLLKFPDAK